MWWDLDNASQCLKMHNSCFERNVSVLVYFNVAAWYDTTSFHICFYICFYIEKLSEAIIPLSLYTYCDCQTIVQTTVDYRHNGK